MNRPLLGTLVAVALVAPASAQQIRMIAAPDHKAVVEAEVQSQPVRAMAVDAKVTTGRPYSAEAVTEFNQVLSDGNRISRKSTTRIYRDTEGRTRREQIGDEGVTSISINDPVSHQTYTLDPATRTGYKSQVRTVAPSMIADKIELRSDGTTAAVRSAGTATGSAEEQRRREVEIQAKAAAAGNPPAATAVPQGGGGGGRGGAVAGPLQPAVRERAGTSTSRESLGQQMMEGVLVEGTRTTTTIAAGTMGNQAPIVVVSEQWFSPDLEVLVMTRHSDPRSGESVYRLTNIARGEPNRSLFEVPSDYTIKEGIRRQGAIAPVMRD